MQKILKFSVFLFASFLAGSGAQAAQFHSHSTIYNCGFFAADMSSQSQILFGSSSKYRGCLSTSHMRFEQGRWKKIHRDVTVGSSLDEAVVHRNHAHGGGSNACMKLKVSTNHVYELKRGGAWEDARNHDTSQTGPGSDERKN